MVQGPAGFDPLAPGRGEGGTRVPESRAHASDLGGVLRPAREGNAFTETVERLLTAISLGLVAPGERFPPERELAAQLGVSRLTLREAIGELQRAGYVSSRRGRFGGTFVTGTRSPDAIGRASVVDAASLDDALAFRLVLETGAAEALANRFAEPGDMDTVSARDALLAKLAEVNAAEPRDYRRLDTLFHLCIAELVGSSLLATACADARSRLNDLLNSRPVQQRTIDKMTGQHEQIAAAIMSGDAELARKTVASHLAGTSALLRRSVSLALSGAYSWAGEASRMLLKPTTRVSGPRRLRFGL